MSRAGSTICAALACCLALACGGTQSTGPRGTTINEAVLACEYTLESMSALDLENDSEATLEAAMNLADEREIECREHFARAARSNGQRAIFSRRADSFTLYALHVEAALSRRFDGFEGYCTILGDMGRLLVGGIASMQDALTDETIVDEERRSITELVGLDFESLQVLSVQMESFCQ